MTTTPSVRLFLAIIGPALAWPALLHAVDAPPSDPIVQLSPFEVTGDNDRGYGTTNSLGATRMNISVLDSPQVIVSLTEKFMQDTGLFEMEELAQYIAGISHASTKKTGNVTMRGTTVGGLGLTDGMRESLSGPSFDPIGVSRFEFLKGPAGALYGSQNVGGVMNRVMKRPLRGPQTTLRFSLDEVANSNLARMEVDTSNRLLNGKLGYRLAAAFQDGKEQSKNSNKRTALYSFIEYAVAANAKAWTRLEAQFFDRTTPSSTFRAGSYSAADPARRSYGLGILPLTSAVTGPGDTTFRLTDLYLGETGFQYDIGRWTLKLVGRASFDKTFGQTYHGNNYDFIAADGRVLGNQNNTIFENPNWVDIRTRGSSYDVTSSNGVTGGAYVDLAGRFEVGPTRHQMLTYASLFTSEGWNTLLRYNPVSQSLIKPRALNLRVSQWQTTNLPPDMTFNSVVTSSRNNGDTFSFGIQDVAKLFSDRLVISAGIGFQGFRSNSNNRLNPANNVINEKNSDWSPSYGLVYRITPDVSLFANHAETFSPRSGFDSLGTPLRNGSGESDEFGVKVNLWNGRLTGTLAKFETTEDGFSVTTLINGFPASIQGGVATNTGWELDITAQPFAGFSLLGGVSDIEAKSATGQYFRNANTGFNWGVFAQYELPMKPLTGMSVSLGYRSMAERFGDGGNTFLLPGYRTVSAGIGYARKAWRVQLQAENLLNEAYIATAVNASNIYFGDPRRWRLTTTYKF
jgi:iron complex outermembrane receptor protein